MVRVLGVFCLLIGIGFLGQAYLLAFHGFYLDCYAVDWSRGCLKRGFDDVGAFVYVIAIAFVVASPLPFYMAAKAFKWKQNRPARIKQKHERRKNS